MNQSIKTSVGMVIIIIIAVTAGVFVWRFSHWDTAPEAPVFVQKPKENKIACTMEAKLCSDGTYVSRSGPNCEFTPCPESKQTNNDDVIRGVSENQFLIDNIKITLPKNWIISKIQNEAVYIKDFDYNAKYDVFLVLQNIKKYPLAGSYYADEKGRFKNFLIKNGSVFQIVQGGVFSVTAVATGGSVYELPWNIDGNEPIPANIDGPWQPSSSFTQEKIWEMMKNISI